MVPGTRFHSSTRVKPLTRYGTIKNDSAGLYVYNSSRAGCMELHELHVEEYAGVDRVETMVPKYRGWAGG